MKSTLVLFLCCFMSCSIALASTETVVCTATDFGQKCTNCTHSIVCTGSTIPETVECRSPYSYCDSTVNACTIDKPAHCDTDAATFKCPSEGFFPDPKVCTTFYYCSAAAATAQTWVCPENYVYDSLNKNCKRMVSDADCVTMQCVTENTFIVNSRNANVIAFCDKDLLANLYKCPEPAV